MRRSQLATLWPCWPRARQQQCIRTGKQQHVTAARKEHKLQASGLVRMAAYHQVLRAVPRAQQLAVSYYIKCHFAEAGRPQLCLSHSHSVCTAGRDLLATMQALPATVKNVAVLEGA
jgi:hypothetical protein